ncbi:HotDog domain-containing protein [Mycena alexandri]|uniref:HotDog domain-containing protein n=1 Tax=Mycena alexandri TaxID=1745969 RepID=A0AAD6SNU0_9AGAR|nr:HotDog domain-containing protein [Mycena alexandri]
MSLFLFGRTVASRLGIHSFSLRSRSPHLIARTAATTPASIPTPPSSRPFGTFATISLVSAFSLGAYTLGALYPPPPISLLYPRPAPPPPADATSPESLAHIAALETELQALPALHAHRTLPDAEEWYETRPHEAIPEPVRVNKLTSGALRGPGKLALFPLARVRKDESAAVIFVHLGRGLCGHDGIIHGGLLATLLDEALGRNAIINLPEKVGVTATLSLKYKAPTRADQFVVMKTELVELKGRKARVSGRVEALDGTLLVEAEALFIQPRYASLLNTTVIRQHMGAAPPPEPVLVADGGIMPK